MRSRKAQQRVARGEWRNPAKLNPPDATRISAGVRRVRKREVADGRWRNPALSPMAREKLSRPRKHGDNPVLHRAIENLRRMHMADLTPEEREAHRVYRRRLWAARRDELSAQARARYRARQAAMTPQEREAQRAKWREQNRRRAKRRRGGGD